MQGTSEASWCQRVADGIHDSHQLPLTFTTLAQVPALQHLVQQRLNLPILAFYQCDQGLSVLVCIQQGGFAVPAA